MRVFTAVTACTPPYRRDAAVLKQTCKRWGVPLIVNEYDDRGSWTENAKAKPEFIMAAMEDHQNVLWLDADARVLADPMGLLSISGDAVVHRRKDGQVNSATVLFRRTELGFGLLIEWIAALTAPSYIPLYGDQDALEKLVGRTKATVGFMGVEYCCIFDLDWLEYPGVNPIILQTQASRRLR